MNTKQVTRKDYFEALGRLWGGTLFHRCAADKIDEERRAFLLVAEQWGVMFALRLLDGKRIYCIDGRVLFDADLNVN